MRPIPIFLFTDNVLTFCHDSLRNYTQYVSINNNSNNEEQPQPEELDIDSNWDEATESFDAMELPEELLRGIYAYGFEKPSAIQQRAIKPTMLGRDLIAQAQSGTVGT